MSELYVLTLCHYRVPAETVCYGSHNIRKEQCRNCLIYHQKRPIVFNANIIENRRVQVRQVAFAVVTEVKNLP